MEETINNIVEFVNEGFKNCGGEIIGGILLTLALWLFPGLKKLINHDADTSEEANRKYRKAVIFVALLILAVFAFARLWGFIHKPDIKPSGSEQADSKEQYELGRKYYNAENYEQAAYHYRKAAEQGNAYAQNDLGFMYQNGYGVSQNYEEAVRLYRLSAGQSYAEAQLNLGIMYEKGYGVLQNYEEAVRLYRLSAGQGNSYAQCNLGGMYYSGDGVPQDYNEAVRLYRLSAQQGNANAQYNLGVMYENGYGVAKNLQEARKYYQMSADQGDEDAKEALQRLR